MNLYSKISLFPSCSSCSTVQNEVPKPCHSNLVVYIVSSKRDSVLFQTVNGCPIPSFPLEDHWMTEWKWNMKKKIWRPSAGMQRWQRLFLLWSTGGSSFRIPWLKRNLRTHLGSVGKKCHTELWYLPRHRIWNRVYRMVPAHDIRIPWICLKFQSCWSIIICCISSNQHFE